MKAFSIQQPWGSLICAGIKDVENRKWALKATPLTVLIHVGAKRHKINENTMPLIWANPIENAQTMGIIGKIADLPTSAIIGIATIDRCDAENFSIWAQDGPGAEYKWVICDVKLFKKPILNIKGKLGIFEIPELTLDNLPECVKVQTLQRDNKHLTIPVSRKIFNAIQDGERDSVTFNLTDNNLSAFATKSLQPKPTETVTFICDDESLDADIAQYSIEAVLNPNTKRATKFYDFFEREYEWYRVVIKID